MVRYNKTVGLPLSEGDMTICSPSTGNIARGLRPRAISPASGEQIVMSSSLEGNNCIILHGHVKTLRNVFSHRRWIRELTFRMGGGLYYLWSKNKGTDWSAERYREAHLRLCFRICKNRGFIMTRLIFRMIKKSSIKEYWPLTSSVIIW